MGYQKIEARMAAIDRAVEEGRGDTQVEALIKLSCVGESSSRDWALTRLADICEQSDSDFVLAATKLMARANVLDPEQMNRTNALEIIDWIGDRSDWHRILTGLSDTYWVARASAIDAAVSRMGKRAIPYVRRMLQDKQQIVRAYACMGLYDLIGPDARDEAGHVLSKQREPKARIHVLGVLAKCGDGVALAELRKFTKSEFASVRDVARRTLAEVETFQSSTR